MRSRTGAKSMALFAMALLATVAMSSCSGPTLPSYEAIPASEGRIVHHARGETVVPRNPQRIVLLGSIVDALALGVKPVGAAFSGFPDRADGEELAPMLSDRTEGITVLGHSSRPSLERIVELQPDLIMGSKGMENIYPRLSQIAPTVVVDLSGGAKAWKEYVLQSATALGKPDEAQALIQQFEQRIAQFREAMGDRLNETVISVARFRPDQFRIYQHNSFSGAVLADIGLPRPESQQQNRSYTIANIENLDTMDGDVLFFMQDNPEKSTLSKVQENPLWSQLAVVQQDQVHEVSLEVWFLNPGIVSAHMMLNDLFRALVPDGKQYVVDRVGELPLP